LLPLLFLPAINIVPPKYSMVISPAYPIILQKMPLKKGVAIKIQELNDNALLRGIRLWSKPL
jgi:hypothetical protein